MWTNSQINLKKNMSLVVLLIILITDINLRGADSPFVFLSPSDKNF